MNCEEVQERLSEAVLDRVSAAAADITHIEDCVSCRAHERFLRELTTAFDQVVVRPASSPALARCQLRAQRALRASHIPSGIAGELLHVLALALIPLPFVLAYAFIVARGASTLLAAWLPEAVLVWLGMVYFGSLALSIGAVYGSLPLVVARRRALRERP